MVAGDVVKRGLYPGHSCEGVDDCGSCMPPILESMPSLSPQLTRSSSPSSSSDDGDAGRSRSPVFYPRHSTSSPKPSLCCCTCSGLGVPERSVCCCSCSGLGVPDGLLDVAGRPKNAVICPAAGGTFASRAAFSLASFKLNLLHQ